MNQSKSRNIKIFLLLSMIMSVTILIVIFLLYYFMMESENQYRFKDTREFSERNGVVKKETSLEDLEVVKLSLKERIIKNIEDIDNCEIEHTYLEEEEGIGYASSFTFEFKHIDESDFVHKIDFKDGRAFVSETWKVDWRTTFGSGHDFKRTENFKIYIVDAEKRVF